MALSAHSHAFRLWRALGAEQPVSRLVLAMLLAWLQERPLPTRASSLHPEEKTRLRSLAVSLDPSPWLQSVQSGHVARCAAEGSPALAWR